MKAYKPKSLVAVSRYQNYFPTMTTDVQQDVYARMEELIEEEKGYCDKGNYKHMAQIFTSIALYEVLQNHGKSEELCLTGRKRLALATTNAIST